ncbi:MarR family transcriptional regulator [Sulfuracidifex metallicus]|uniref:ArnR1-like winged helix-turn-helix domain-containing protein n=2 Tax=Sulfuracidifex metallicus TaxID=47303 RepID=A0A6A9QNU3_SULME|nr:helix-turn-helix domain-containing protein [Sulfuracidifex metallicus]MUN29990.1 hypothetical protein [Sulfuracidifex metallicus DSM 6482 = JCM 9184]WOE51628.1 helix-turn-helix domain-containing protein [Sulfuracidifex metallicus DSM 6482 = JCM 9184]
MSLDINERTKSLLSTPLLVLLLIDKAGEASISDLIRTSKGMSASTITRYVKELNDLGLIEIETTRSSVGTEKKIIRITQKGKEIINNIKKLNEILS